MAETVFTGKQIEEFAADQTSRPITFLLAVLPRLSKNLLMRDGPGNTGNWNA
jgi:hypothetical protein